MRAPAEFVVLRHLVTHKDDAPSDLAKHCNLYLKSASLVLARLRDADVWTEPQILARLRIVAERPRWRTLGYVCPNPAQWLKAHRGPHLLSGDEAAAREGVPIVPERVIAWIQPDELAAALRAADAVVARPTRAQTANLVLRIMDPWLAADPKRPELVERGQRLLDYEAFPNIQVLRGRK